MKKIDGYGLKICAFQAELFKESLTVQNCSSKIFIRRFMYSDLAARMDANGFYYASYSITDAFGGYRQHRQIHVRIVVHAPDNR